MDEQYQDINNVIYKAGMEGRRLKNIYNVNGTAIAMDATLSRWHTIDNTPGLEREDRAANIFELQEDIAKIMAFMLSTDEIHNPFFFTEFDEENAW